MSNPTKKDWTALKRLGRYLLGNQRLVIWYEWDRSRGRIISHSDSDWAGCPTTRKSTSGGTAQIGKHLIKAWSSSQSVIALSSGEAELYALTKAASQTLGIMTMAKDFGDMLEAEIKCDANATLAMVHRSGLGKVRHVEVQYLWIQSYVADKKFALKKVAGADNAADLLTKHVPQELMHHHLKNINCRITIGRARTAPQL
eukprot:12397718-Karenia_brevis.AAC.1